MSETGDSREPHRIGAAAKSAFLAALRAGARREDAAAEAGFSLMGFYGARARDAAFKADWAEALATPPAKERRRGAYEERGKGGSRREERITSANLRLWQRRRRLVRFDAARQEIFLAHFAVSGDAEAAADAAGVCASTVHRLRRKNREFCEAYYEALDQAYLFLQAEAVRLQLEAQARYRAAIERAEFGSVERACPHCRRSDDPAADFDRVMRLLARYERKPRGVECRFTPGGQRQRWTFDAAMELLDKKLHSLGIRQAQKRAKEREAAREQRARYSRRRRPPGRRGGGHRVRRTRPTSRDNGRVAEAAPHRHSGLDPESNFLRCHDFRFLPRSWSCECSMRWGFSRGSSPRSTANISITRHARPAAGS